MTFFFFNDTAPTEIYTLSLHDALPIYDIDVFDESEVLWAVATRVQADRDLVVVSGSLGDRKSTRLNSSHGHISYAVFCLKKKRSPTRATARCEPSTRSPCPCHSPRDCA